MNDLEQQLASLRRRPPSAALDARVAETLRRTPPLLARPVPAWACAAAALLGLLAGALLAGWPAPISTADGAVALQFAAAGPADAGFPFTGRRFIHAEEKSP